MCVWPNVSVCAHACEWNGGECRCSDVVWRLAGPDRAAYRKCFSCKLFADSKAATAGRPEEQKTSPRSPTGRHQAGWQSCPYNSSCGLFHGIQRRSVVTFRNSPPEPFSPLGVSAIHFPPEPRVQSSPTRHPPPPGRVSHNNKCTGQVGGPAHQSPRLQKSMQQATEE